VTSVREAAGRPHGRFLLARFLYVDALATVIAFMTVYARRTGDFSSGELNVLLAGSTGSAIVGALAAGALATRVGPKRVLIGTLAVVVAALVAAAVSGSSELLWVVGPLVGAALGSVAATDRVLLLRLIPPERRGEGFGLYALVGKGVEWIRTARPLGRHDRPSRRRTRADQRARGKPHRGRRPCGKRPGGTDAAALPTGPPLETGDLSA
jgi:MFS-type transporter involved in bile tolerance (Atg22 family)